MSKIYVPSYTNNSCVHIVDKDVIRVYESVPTNGSYVAYTDFFINSHYLSSEDLEYFDSQSSLPTCVNINDLTNDFYYRNDLSDILIIFIIISLVCIYLPYKIFSRLFGRWLKV